MPFWAWTSSLTKLEFVRSNVCHTMASGLVDAFMEYDTRRSYEKKSEEPHRSIGNCLMHRHHVLGTRCEQVRVRAHRNGVSRFGAM